MIGTRCQMLLASIAFSLPTTTTYAQDHAVARIEVADQINEIVQHYQAQYDVEQGLDLRNNNAGKPEKPETGVLTLDFHNVYDIQITPSGQSATILVPDFHCSNIGHAWCGSGGCGFYIIVDNIIFFREIGFRPQSITTKAGHALRTILIYGIHGSGCTDAEGKVAAGVDPCFGNAVWDARKKTFFSREGEIKVWKAD